MWDPFLGTVYLRGGWGRWLLLPWAVAPWRTAGERSHLPLVILRFAAGAEAVDADVLHGHAADPA